MRGHARKDAYKKMAAEGQDKEARNQALARALEEGGGNIKAAGKKKWIRTVDPVTGKKTRTAVREPKELVQPKLPTSASQQSSLGQAAKRAIRKARKHRLVRDLNHPNGQCGNPGCERCFPQFRRHRKNERQQKNAA
jgi:hypothetical protein